MDGSSNTRKITCYYCKELGHFNFKCPKLKNKSQAAIVQSKQKKNYDSEEDLALVDYVESRESYDFWVLDSSCSFHMSPRQDWFDIYESCFGESVTVGNDASCEV